MLLVKADGEDAVTIVLAPDAGRHLVDISLRGQIGVTVLTVDEDTEVVFVFIDGCRAALARTLGWMIGLLEHLAYHPCRQCLVEGAKQFDDIG